MTDQLQEIKAEIKELRTLLAQAKRPIEDGALYSPPEAAAVCSVSPDTIYRARINGHLPSVQVGGSPRYWGKDLKAWINSGGATGRNRGTVERERATA